MQVDRLKGPLQALARRADPLQAYRCTYRARLVAQSADRLRVDVEPDDPLLPPMSNIPLQHGIPGLRVQVKPGASLLVGWKNARPDLPFAALWADGADVLSISLESALIELGDGVLPLSEAIRGTEYRQAENIFLVALQAYAAAIKAIADPTGIATATLTAAITAFGEPTDLVALAKIVKVT